jgi:hypothetical protein
MEAQESFVVLAVAGVTLVAVMATFVAVFFAALHVGRKVGEHGGITGAILGGRVTQTLGEVQAAPRNIASIRLRVLGVEREDGAREAGLEIAVNAKLGYRLTAVRLTPEEARRVADALEDAGRG